jgi:3D (Asp-Asp-Asp) domain-containing protein
MSSIYYPARGFRFFKGMSRKWIKALVALAILAYPVTIQADAAKLPVSPAALPIASITTTAPETATTASNAQAPAINMADTQLAWITAYTSDPDQTSDHPLITASGNMVRDGIVADNTLPFGTKIEIPSLFGNKVFVVEDRTNQKFSGRVDIWMPTDAKAVAFGIEHAQIVVLNSNTNLALQ